MKKLKDLPDLKYFTMRISTKLHTEVKRFCAEYQISMKDFSQEAYVRHLMYLEEKVEEIKTNRNRALFSNFDESND